MTERDPHLLSIGRFSDATRLSVKALRLYDELGLLTPRYVDGSNGYRYYGPDQASRATAIRLLRKVDMPLEEIGQVLDAAETRRSELMTAHLRRLEEALRSHREKVAAFRDLMEGNEPLIAYEVERKEMPDQQVASITSEVTMGTVGEAIASGFAAIMSALGTAGIGPTGAPFLVMHDVIDEENEGTIEICIPVAAGFAGQDLVRSRLLVGGTAAATTHRGAYDEVAPAYHAVSSWMADNGWEPSGPPRETYLNDPTQVSLDEQLTEVAWPMKEVGT